MPGQTLFIVFLGLLVGRARVLGLGLPFAAAAYSVVRHGRPRASTAAGLALCVGCLSGGNLWLAFRLAVALLVIDAAARWMGRHGRLRAGPKAGLPAGFVFASICSSHLPTAVLSGLGGGDLIFVLAEAAVGAVLGLILHKGLIGSAVELNVDLTAGESLPAVILVFAAALTGLRGVSIGGMSLVVVTGAAVTMFLARAGGGAVGALAGVAAGMVAGLSGEAGPALTGIWAVAGMLSGIGGDFGTAGAAVGFLLGMLCLAGVVEESGYLRAALEQAVIAAVLLALVPGRIVSRVRLACRGPDAADHSTQLSSALLLVGSSRLSALAGMFREIAATFDEPGVAGGECPSAAAAAAASTVSATARASLDLPGAIEEVTTACCADCSQRKACWGDRSDHTSRGLASLMRKLGRQAGAAENVEPKAFIPWCSRSQDVLAVACRAVGTRLTVRSSTARTSEARRLLGRQLSGVARITSDLAQQMTIGEIPSGLLRAREIEDALRRAGCRCSQALLTPSRRGFEVHVQAEPCGGSWCAERGPAVAGAVLGRRLVLAGKRCELPGGGCHFILATAPRFELVVGKARQARGREVVSGDSYLHRLIGPDRYLLLLSDGMGSGLPAARESNTAIRLIQAMLEARFPVEETIQTINSILILRSPAEVFATVDLAIVDLGDGAVEMAKIGACPSYLVHNGEVEVLAAKGLPLGIVDDIAVTRLQERLRPGDLLIMISDGVLGPATGAPRREDRVRRQLAGQKATEPQRLAEELLAGALERSPGTTLDDAAVLVARLQKTRPGG